MVGSNQELVADVVDDAEAVVADLRHDRSERLVALREIAVEKRISVLSFAAFGDVRDREALILGGADVWKRCGFCFVFVNQLVF